MTIDEAIAHAREVAEEQRKACDLAWVWDNTNNIKKCAEEHEQLAEWLEELKALKNGLNIKCDNLNEALEKGKKIGYKKAIDDFADKLLSQQIVDKSVVRRVKEQLKAGGENE